MGVLNSVGDGQQDNRKSFSLEEGKHPSLATEEILIQTTNRTTIQTRLSQAHGDEESHGLLLIPGFMNLPITEAAKGIFTYNGRFSACSKPSCEMHSMRKYCFLATSRDVRLETL
jgi:hypothetical protein